MKSLQVLTKKIGCRLTLKNLVKVLQKLMSIVISSLGQFTSKVRQLGDEFLGIIGNELSGKYKDPTHNHFCHKTISVLAETKISMETFLKWQDEVIAGFNEKNWLSV